jgi:hypothetical protein
MLAVVYIEAAFVALLTLGYLLLTAIGVSASNAPTWYQIAFAIGGTSGLASLWWCVVASILRLQKNRHYDTPMLVKLGIGVGFAFSSFIVLHPWLNESAGYVVNQFPVGLALLVSIPCGIALHQLYLLEHCLDGS